MPLPLIRDLITENGGAIVGAVVTHVHDEAENDAKEDHLAINIAHGDAVYTDNVKVDMEHQNVRRLGGWKPRKGEIVDLFGTTETAGSEEETKAGMPLVIPAGE